MHQREASSYARSFFYGRKRLSLTTQVLENLRAEPGIGMVPPEFDDLDGGEHDAVAELSEGAGVLVTQDRIER